MRASLTIANTLTIIGLVAGMVTLTNPALADDQLMEAAGVRSFQQVVRKVIFDPFWKASGIKVTEAEYGYGLAKIPAMVETRSVNCDAIWAGDSAVREFCAEGSVKTIDWKKLGLDRPEFEGVSSTDSGVPSSVSAAVAVPKGTARLGSAYKFIAFASSPQAHADVANHTGEGTGNKDAIAFVNWAILPNLPNEPDRALRSDASFRSEKGDKIRQRFTAWLAK
ncbi:hypothetical protein XH84_32170 [Bradyrhizobium nanningense]|uniref:hypothetical protein n=1 Tax=Bradyrhizobium nanningense TaxID=1325118 RepID=UPI0010091EF7|nr:hypothetical protein [Bradyrhizobium nanningense]RXH24759.1 hypothetical protein XH84_32170 [Bradyrhizobium nanningense]